MAKNWMNMDMDFYRIVYPEAFTNPKNSDEKIKLLQPKMKASCLLYDFINEENRIKIDKVIDWLANNRNVCNFRFITETFGEEECFPIPMLMILSQKEREKNIKSMVMMAVTSLGFILFDYSEDNKKYVSAFHFSENGIFCVGAANGSKLNKYYKDEEWYTPFIDF